MAEDIYPLGPGGPGTYGTLWDILNFALNNAKQYADRLPTSQPEMRMTAEDVAAINPAAGLAGTLGKITSKAEKKVVSSLAKNAPDLLDQIIKDPTQTTFKVGTPWSNSMASGVMEGGNLIPNKTITIAPEVLRGKLPSSVKNVFPEYADLTGKESMFANLPAVVAHEGQHAVNKKALDKMTPGEMGEWAMDMIRRLGDKPGTNQIKESVISSPRLGADEALAYLQQHQVAGDTLGGYADEILKPLNRLFEPKGTSPYRQALNPQQQYMMSKAPRGYRSQQNAEDLRRLNMGEELPLLGSELPQLSAVDIIEQMLGRR